jgi:ABC-type amino acid transport substrate-binding protein
MKRLYSIALVILVLALVFTGCASTAAAPSQSATASSPAAASSSAAAPESAAPSASESASASASAASGDVETVKVGTMGTYEPFTYQDADGKLTGYDIEVLRLVEKADPTLKFDFITGPWDSLFPGLDADKFQLLANQIVSNPDREAKYLLTDNTYSVCVSQLIVKKGRTDIKSLNDLKGKKIGTTVGDSFTRLLEDWNGQNGKILDIVYYEEDITTVLQDIANGRIDATLNDPIMAAEKAKAQKLEVEPVGDRVAEQPTHFIFKKDDAGAKLKEKVDNALSKLKADGSLSKLSIDWFGADYTK